MAFLGDKRPTGTTAQAYIWCDAAGGARSGLTRELVTRLRVAGGRHRGSGGSRDPEVGPARPSCQDTHTLRECRSLQGLMEDPAEP